MGFFGSIRGKNKSLVWKHDCDAQVNRMFVSADRSSIGVGTISSVYLLDWSGNRIWGHKIGRPVYGVHVTVDRSVIAGALDGKVIQLDRTGRLQWSFETGERNQEVRAISVTADASLIAVRMEDDTNSVCLLDRQGKCLWRGGSGGGYCVAISSDGSVVAVPFDHGVSLYKSSGELLRNREIGRVNGFSFSQDASLLAVASEVDEHGMICALSLSGDLLWQNTTDALIRSVITSGEGSALAVGTYRGDILTFDRLGKLIWKYNTGERVEDISISADTSMIAAASDTKAYTFSRLGELFWSHSTDEIAGPISLTSDGSTVVATWGKMLYLFEIKHS